MKKYTVVIKNINDKAYRKIIGTRNTVKKAEKLQILMMSRIANDYYVDIEVQNEI